MSNTRDLGPGTITIDDETYGTLTFDVGSQRYTVRELSVDEGDAALAAAKGPDDKVNETINTRMLLATAIVEPATNVGQIGKFGSLKYLKVLQAFNALNTLPVADPTLPAGSAGPTSPSGGESSLATSADSQPASTSEWSGSQPTP